MPSLMQAHAATVYASTARTASPAAVDFALAGPALGYATGLIVVIRATALVSTPSVTFTVAGVDDVSGEAYTILTSAAVTTAPSTKVMRIHPQYTAAADIAKDCIPPRFRVSATHGNANSITYSVGLMLLP